VDEDRDRRGWIKELVKALDDGTGVDLAPGEAVDVSQAPGWPDPRRLPGEALRAALLEPDVKPDPRGLMIRGAYITGTTDLADLTLTFGLEFDSCAFEQLASWQRLTVASLRVIRCTMSGLILQEAHMNELALRRSTLINLGGRALSLDGGYVRGRVDLTGVTMIGELGATCATIAGQFDLGDATITNEGGVALLLDGADVRDGVFLGHATVTGQVRAHGARIGTTFDLNDATLINKGKPALSLDGAEIKGSAVLNRISLTGRMSAIGVTIGGELSLEGATLTNRGGRALSLDRSEIKGAAFLGEMTAIGRVGASSVTIGNILDLQGANLSNEGGAALHLQSAKLNILRLLPAALKGSVVLDAAQITVLTMPRDENYMKVLIGNELSASGWRLGDVRGLIRHDRSAAADWLSRDNAAKEFVAQPWHELASVYDRNGQPADARWLRWKAAQGVTRTSPSSSKLIRKIYGALTGHGYYPLIAAVWLILAIVASGIIVAANPAVFTPTAANKAAWKAPPPIGQSAPPITGATPCVELQDRSSCLNPVLYAFDNALPGTLATGQAAQWTANGAQGWNTWIPYTLGGLKIASWILVALLLAGVTGLLRKT
jgi:hypothetical protein